METRCIFWVPKWVYIILVKGSAAVGKWHCSWCFRPNHPHTTALLPLPSLNLSVHNPCELYHWSVLKYYHKLHCHTSGAPGCWVCNTVATESRGWEVGTPTLYAVGPGFKSQPGDRISSVWFSWFYGFFLTNIGVKPQFRPQPLPSISFRINILMIVLLEAL